MSADAPTRSADVSPPAQSLNALIKQGYPSNAPCLYMRTVVVPAEHHYTFSSSLYDYPGFSKDVIQVNQMVDLVSITVRTLSFRENTTFLVGLTANASAGHSEAAIMSMKSMFARRVTSLTMGMETHQLPLHLGMSSMVKPANVSGLYPCLAVNVQGEGSITVILEYERSGGAIQSSSVTSDQKNTAVSTR